MKKKLSIIIPVLNEEIQLPKLLGQLRDLDSRAEIIIVDGGSTDSTLGIASTFDSTVVHTDKPGRAVQMNAGAKKAIGDILFFLHVDSVLPKNFEQSIELAINDDLRYGCFRLKFDVRSRILDFYAWFTRFKIHAFRFLLCFFRIV